jgi:hypothetical protein
MRLGRRWGEDLMEMFGIFLLGGLLVCNLHESLI